MTGEWEHQLRLMARGKFPREKFMAALSSKRKASRRVKGFEEDDSVARITILFAHRRQAAP